MEVVTEKPTTKVVPEGYKRTEVGVIPKDWDVERIKNIATIVRGGSPRPAGDPKYFGGQFIPWLTVASLTNISDSQIYVIKTNGYLTELGSTKSRILEKGTVIISNSGATLGVAKILDIKCCANDGIAALNTLNNEISDKFLVYYINSITDYLRNDVAMGVGQRNLNTELIGEIKFPFPPTLEEQQAIAEALSDVDALIAKLDALIEKKQQVKKGAMQQLLTGKNRLPGFDGEWEEKKLGDVLYFQTGNPFSSKYFNENGFGKRLIKNRDLKSDEQVIYYSGPHSQADVVENGDLLVGMDGDFIPCLWDKGTALLNQRVGRINANGDVSIKFLFYYIKEPLQNIQYKTSATTVKHLSHNDIEKMELPLPELEEQKAIAQILSDMDSEIQALQAKRAKYEKIKQGMMQELLTGKTRLVSKSENQRESKDQKKSGHNWQIDEAVLISVVSGRFGSKEYPIGRFRRTKFSYLVRRFLKSKVDQFLKKAAGPYNPKTKYSGPEKIALENRYVQEWENGKYSGFVADANIAEAQSYFEDWYGSEVLDWLDEGFRFKKNEDLELLTTVDKSIVELKGESKEVSLDNVKYVIASHPKWKEKLEREIFSDKNIQESIKESFELFGGR